MNFKMRRILLIIFLLTSTKLFSQESDVVYEEVTERELSMDLAEQLHSSALAGAISLLEEKGFKKLTVAEMKLEDPRLTDEKIYLPEGKQRTYYLRKNSAYSFGPNKVNIQLRADERIEVLTWNEHIKFVSKYTFDFKYGGYENIQDGKEKVIGGGGLAYPFHYSHARKKNEVYIRVGKESELVFTLSKSE